MIYFWVLLREGGVIRNLNFFCIPQVYLKTIIFFCLHDTCLTWLVQGGKHFKFWWVGGVDVVLMSHVDVAILMMSRWLAKPVTLTRSKNMWQPVQHVTKKDCKKFTLKMTSSTSHYDVNKTTTSAGDISTMSTPPAHKILNTFLLETTKLDKRHTRKWFDSLEVYLRSKRKFKF